MALQGKSILDVVKTLNAEALGDGKRQESADRASCLGRVNLALLSIRRDGLLRRSEAAALTWGDVELRYKDVLDAAWVFTGCWPPTRTNQFREFLQSCKKVTDRHRCSKNYTGTYQHPRQNFH